MKTFKGFKTLIKKSTVEELEHMIENYNSIIEHTIDRELIECYTAHMNLIYKQLAKRNKYNKHKN